MPGDDKQAEKEAKAAAKEEKKKKKAEAQGAEAASDEDEGGIGTKIAVFLASLVIIALWLGIFVLIVKWDVGGFGSTVMYPVFKNVPYLNMILPEVKETDEDPDHSFATIDDAVEYIKMLERELAGEQEKVASKNKRIEELKSKIEKLKSYETKIKEFDDLKKKFDEEVVFSDEAPDISYYQEYYAQISPENAERIYKQVLEQQQYNSELDNYVKTYSNMKAKNAAKIFDTMTDNLTLVAEILEKMDAESRGEILGNMDAEIAARVTEILYPDKNKK
ncbi:MAG: hypothetical protein K5929_11100 [Lachnospiraceae bacterium]|nr:hypothetical protein [Lachnospiraceae bacterium]